MRSALPRLLCCLILAAPFAAPRAASADGMPVVLADFMEELRAAIEPAEGLEEALMDAGQNWLSLADALWQTRPSAADEQQYRAIEWMILNAPHLDRLEMDSAQLRDNARLAFEHGGSRGYSPDSDFYRRYILNYRLDDEPVTSWRPLLAERYRADARTLAEPDAEIAWIVEKAGSGFTVLSRGYFGNQADPVSIDNARAGTGAEFALLTAAALRSRGFATRFVREGRTGQSWVEVFTGMPEALSQAEEGTITWDDPTGDESLWLPIYPGHPEHSFDPYFASELCGGRICVVTAGDAFGREQVTARYSAVGKVQPLIERDNAALPDYEHFSISAWFEGRWVPLDDLEYPLSAMDYPLSEGASEAAEGSPPQFLLGPGDYRLTAGARYPGGYVHVRTSEFQASERYLAQPSVDLTAPADIPLSALVEHSVDKTLLTGRAAYLSSGTWLILAGDDSEPSIRADEMLREIDLRGGSFIFLESALLPAEGEDPESMSTPEASVAAPLGLRPNDVMPVVILLVDGETRLYIRGYNLNVGQWVERALGE